MWFHQLDLFPHFSYLSVGFFILSMYIGFPYLLLLPVLVLSFGVFLPGPPHVSQCCYSSPNFLCGCFLVLGPLLLLYQLYLHVSPFILPDGCNTRRPLPILAACFTGILYLPVFEL